MAPLDGEWAAATTVSRDDELDVPDDDDRRISQRSPVLGILTVVGAALVVAVVGWLLALGMTLLAP